MVNLTQLILPQAAEGQNQSKESAKARKTDTGVPFSQYVDKASKDAGKNGRGAERTSTKREAVHGAKRDGQGTEQADVDWTAAAAVAASQQQGQAQQAQGEPLVTDNAEAANNMAQEAPVVVTPIQASVDTLEGVELFNIVDEALGTGMDAGKADNTAHFADMADDTDVEHILTMAEDNIDYVTGNQPNPLENVNSGAAKEAFAINAGAYGVTQNNEDKHADAVPESVENDNILTEELPVQAQDVRQGHGQDNGNTGENEGGEEDATTRETAASGHNPRRTQETDNRHFDAEVTAASQSQTPQVSQQNDAVARLAQNVIEQASAGIERAAAEGESRFTIQMKPEFLGRLAINLVMSEQGLTARIRSSDAGVRGLLNAEMMALTQALKDKGITVVEVQVMQHEMTDLASQQFGGGDRYQGQDGNAQRGNATINTVLPSAGYGEDGNVVDQTAQDLEAVGSTVLYEA